MGEMRIPPVEGQQRNSALAAERRRRAVELILSGRTYQQVADELGYKNRGTVHRMVHAVLARHEAESVATLRDLELARLDRLLQPYFTAALDGDLRAAELVLKISAHRCKLLHLASGREEQPLENRIVVGGTKEEFEEALRAGQMQASGRGSS